MARFDRRHRFRGCTTWPSESGARANVPVWRSRSALGRLKWPQAPATATWSRQDSAKSEAAVWTFASGSKWSPEGTSNCAKAGRDWASHGCRGCDSRWLRRGRAEGERTLYDDLDIEHLDDSDHGAAAQHISAVTDVDVDNTGPSHQPADRDMGWDWLARSKYVVYSIRTQCHPLPNNSRIRMG